MVMGFGIAVEPLLGSADLKLLNQTIFRHQLQVPIDSSQADFRQTFSHHVIEIVSRRVRRYAAQFIKDDLALFGDPEIL